MSQEFTILGKQVREAVKKLETFPNPGVSNVTMKAIEFTWLCPVTGQPDFGTVEIEYVPREFCLESKSLKLYLWTFRERGAFTEALAKEIADDIVEAIQPQEIRVQVFEQARGGIEITALCRLKRGQ